MIRVLIVDDQPMLRVALHLLLEKEKDIQIVGEATDGVEAVQAVEDLDPDVVVMDLNLPRMGGVDATRKIAAHHPRTRVIGYSIYGAHGDEAKLCDAGVCAYVDKSEGLPALVEAIRAVGAGEKAAQP